MFDNPKRDLKYIEEELLAQEDENWLDKELEEARRMLDGNFEETREELDQGDSRQFDAANIPAGVSATNTDQVDVDLDAYSDELLDESPAKREKGVLGLLILIILELLGIAAIGAYWLMQLL